MGGDPNVGLGLDLDLDLDLEADIELESESDLDLDHDIEHDIEPDPDPDPNPDPDPDPEPDPDSDSDSDPDPYPQPDDIPSLDDIIPWTAQERKPRQPEVFDAVRTDQGINLMFVQNALKSYYSKDDVERDVNVENQVEEPMATLNNSLRNILVEVNVDCIVEDRRETHHLVIKTLTASQPTRALSAAHCFDRREVGFYTQILDDISTFQAQEVSDTALHLAAPVAKCFFARYTAPSGEVDPEQDHNIPPDESVLVLENVKYRGFTQTIIDKGLSKEQVLTVFEGIARLHGLSLAMKERSGIPLERSYPYMLCLAEANQSVLELFEKNMPDVLKMLTTLGAPELGEKLTALRPRVEGLLHTLSRPEEPVSVLSHMNLWAHNILFKEDNECIFVDWQMVSSTRPTFDLAFLLASSVNSTLRRLHTEEFLNHYYEKFTRYALRFGLDIRGDVGYTSEHLRQDFAYSQLLALFFCIAKSSDLLISIEAQIQFVDYMHDLEAKNLLNPDVIDIDNIEYVYWIPQNPRSDIIFRIERRRSSSDDDHSSGLFPLQELPEE